MSDWSIRVVDGVNASYLSALVLEKSQAVRVTRASSPTLSRIPPLAEDGRSGLVHARYPQGLDLVEVSIWGRLVYFGIRPSLLFKNPGIHSGSELNPTINMNMENWQAYTEISTVTQVLDQLRHDLGQVSYALSVAEASVAGFSTRLKMLAIVSGVRSHNIGGSPNMHRSKPRQPPEP